jgi:integrase
MSRVYEYHSGLADPIQTYIAEKRALGCKYDKESKIFWELDRFLIQHGLDTLELPQAMVEKWIEKRPNEKRKNQRYRLNFTKRFVLYLQSKGYEAYYPLIKISARDNYDFVPYIFSNAELGSLLDYFDNMSLSRNYPNGHIVFPLLFRTLTCCGLRVAEAAKLRVKDVDLVNGVMLIREAKNDKQRFVPLSGSMRDKFRFYYNEIHQSSEPDDFFFPNVRKNFHHTNVIYDRFREALWHCGIEHKGRGYGPRVHDLRHTFAVRCMIKLEKTKGDIVTSLPYLSVYLGHYNMNKTQMYLRLIEEHYPEVSQKQCEYLGDTIPTWEVRYED